MADNIERVTAEQLSRMVEAFSEMDWPVSRTESRALITALGWTVTSDRSSGMKVRSNLELNVSRVDVLFDDDDNLLKMTIPASGTDHDEKQDLRTTFGALRVGLDSALDGGGVSNDGRKRCHWQLENGARIALENIGFRVILQLLSPRWVHVESAEER